MKTLIAFAFSAMLVSGATFANDLLTNKDCKNLEKAIAATLELQGATKDQIRVVKKVMGDTCREAVKHGLTKEEYAIIMEEILSQI